MPALFPRLKVWVANEVLTYTDLNAEFDNILANLEADTLGGYSASVAQMRLQVNPGGVGSESLAASISGEIERLRFAIARITGRTYWYEAPVKNLSTQFAKVRHIFCPTANNEPIQLSPVSEAYKAGIFSNKIGSSQRTLTAPSGKFSSGSLGNFVSDGNTVYDLDPRCSGGALTYSFWIKGYSNGENILFNKLIGLRAFINASGFLQVDITKPTTTGALKEVVSVTGNVNIAASSTYRHILIAYRLTNSSSDSLTVYLDGVLSGTPITGVAIHGNVPTLNYAAKLNAGFIGTTTISANMNALPETLGWTKTSTGGTASVSNGVLTAVNGTGATQYWSIAPASSGATATNFVEFKIRIRQPSIFSNTYIAAPEQAFSLIVRGGSSGARISISSNSCTLSNSNALAFGTNTNSITFNHNFMDWTHVVLNVDGNLSIVSVIVNGKPAGIVPLGADAAAAAIIFGKTTTTTTAFTYDLEYINSGPGFGAVGGYVPVADCSISDFCVLEGTVTDSGTISSLQLGSPFSLFGEETDRKIKTAVNRSGELTGITVAAGTSANIPTSSPSVDILSDGVTPIRVSFDFDANTVAGAGSFTGNVWLSITGFPSGFTGFQDGNNSVTQSVLNTAGVVDGVIGQRQFVIATIPAGITVPISGTVNATVTLPAGQFTVVPSVYVHTGSVSALFRRYELNASQC